MAAMMAACAGVQQQRAVSFLCVEAHALTELSETRTSDAISNNKDRKQEGSNAVVMELYESSEAE
jgi:hypothetical protein